MAKIILEKCKAFFTDMNKVDVVKTVLSSFSGQLVVMYSIHFRLSQAEPYVTIAGLWGCADVMYVFLVCQGHLEIKAVDRRTAVVFYVHDLL